MYKEYFYKNSLKESLEKGAIVELTFHKVLIQIFFKCGSFRTGMSLAGLPGVLKSLFPGNMVVLETKQIFLQGNFGQPGRQNNSADLDRQQGQSGSFLERMNTRLLSSVLESLGWRCKVLRERVSLTELRFGACSWLYWGSDGKFLPGRTSKNSFSLLSDRAGCLQSLNITEEMKCHKRKQGAVTEGEWRLGLLLRGKAVQKGCF